MGLKVFFTLVVIPALAAVLYILKEVDFFKTPQTFEERYHDCKFVDEITPGPEDIVRYNKTTLLYGSGDMMHLYVQGDPMNAVPGAIYAIYNADTSNYRIEKLYIHDFPMNSVFHPHGLYLLEQDGVKYLLAVNHAFHRISERVEVFTFEEKPDGKLQLNHSFSYYLPEEFNGVFNDLIALSPTHVIVTQWMPYTIARTGYIIEFMSRVKDNQWNVTLKTLKAQLLKQNRTHVYSCRIPNYHPDVHVYKPQCIKIKGTEGIVNNGITYDGEYVYVADSGAKNIKKYRLNTQAKEENLLELVETIPTTFAPDNLEYDRETKKIYIGGLEKIFDYFWIKKQGKDNLGHLPKTYKTGTWTAAYELVDSQVEPVYVAFDVHKGTSISYQLGPNLYLGSWGDESLLVCKSRE